MNTDGGTDDDREDSDGGLVPDPYEPIIVPGGPGVLVGCGRMRTSGGDRVLDTRGEQRMTVLILAGAAVLFAIGFERALWLLDRAEARMERDGPAVD